MSVCGLLCGLCESFRGSFGVGVSIVLCGCGLCVRFGESF